MKQPEAEILGKAQAVIEKIQTTKDGGARITLDMTSIDSDLIKTLLELKLKGTGLITVVFFDQTACINIVINLNMGNFDPSKYETVKSRKQRFYEKYPDGRIDVKLVYPEDIMEKALFMARVFVDEANHQKQLARGTGFALELRDLEKSKTQYGKEYESINFSSWCENAEESAVGRALDNAGFASNMHCSQDEIDKAKRNSAALSTPSLKKALDPVFNPNVIPSNGPPRNGQNDFLISPAQVKRFQAIAMSKGLVFQDQAPWLNDHFKIDDPKKIPIKLYNKIISTLEAFKPGVTRPQQEPPPINDDDLPF